MSIFLCLHGHFYQPPREDPWLGCILSEASAAPMRHWNRRILRESYAPLGFARRLNGTGRITELLNCYEWISFNVGPTLMSWLRYSAPELVECMRLGDQKSLERWGHGNAMAQVYHHVIMPLASERDRELETAWAIADFEKVFNRRPEGMWLSECAVDVPSLETLAAHDIQFVILAPSQAGAVVRNGAPVPVNEGNLAIDRPYLVRLPSGRSMTAVFYHGDLSRRIAFEGLLADGEVFWKRLVAEGHKLQKGTGDALLSLATDGETYGHHFTFGEMALAYVLAQGREGRDGMNLTNIAAFIAANPPVEEVILHEPSSWSCAHGVERWRSDCGCATGDYSGGNQRWRGPLRKALEIVRGAVETHFESEGKKLFVNPWQALVNYGQVLASPARAGEFAKTWFLPKTAKAGKQEFDKAWKLLAMQESSLASFASCAWFFDEIARIEPENAMTYALRSMELMQETGGPDVQESMLRVLAEAESNRPEMGTGKNIFLNEVLPRRSDPATLCLLAALMLLNRGQWPGKGESTVYSWPRVSVELAPDVAFIRESAVPQTITGTAVIRNVMETEGIRYTWSFTPPSEPGCATPPFFTLANSAMVLTDGSGKTYERKVCDFSRPMRDYLLYHALEGSEGSLQSPILSTASQVIALMRLWDEPPPEVIRPDLWGAVSPYLFLACVVADDIKEDQRPWMEEILSRRVSLGERERAMRLVRGAMLRKLTLSALKQNGGQASAEESKEIAVLDETLAEWMRRLLWLLPDMEFWTVQNRVWIIGPKRLPLLAEALGFEMTDRAP